MRLDVEAARRAVRAGVAEPLGLDVIEAAAGIHRIVDENMASAARIHILEKGKDPRRYPLFTFGGAGPVHAHAVARLLGTARIIVPRGAGVTAALGFLAAPIATDQVRTYLTRLDRADWTRVRALLGEMAAAAVATLRAAGVPARGIRVERAADMRYAGQGFEVTAPLPAGRLDARRAEAVARAFLATYRERYGQATRDQPLEAVSWRVRARGPLPRVALPPVPRRRDPRAALTGRRPVWFGRFVPTPVYDRARLGAGAVLRGPAVVEERESTLVVPPGARLAIDLRGNAVVTLPARMQ
jgi:N-methylhydantoinase A